MRAISQRSLSGKNTKILTKRVFSLKSPSSWCLRGCACPVWFWQSHPLLGKSTWNLRMLEWRTQSEAVWQLHMGSAFYGLNWRSLIAANGPEIALDTERAHQLLQQGWPAATSNAAQLAAYSRVCFIEKLKRCSGLLDRWQYRIRQANVPPVLKLKERTRRRGWNRDPKHHTKNQTQEAQRTQVTQIFTHWQLCSPQHCLVLPSRGRRHCRKNSR